jgi:magnesium transporter
MSKTTQLPASRFEGHDVAGLRIVAVRDGAFGEVPLGELIPTLAEPSTVTWIDVERPSPELAADIATCLGLHPLLVQNIAERQHRARIEDVGDVLHLVLFALAYEDEVSTKEIDVVLGRRFLLTVHDDGWSPHDVPMLRMGVGPILGRGADYLLYALSDALVDGYFPVLDRIADAIDELQDEVVEHASREALERLFALKRSLLALRRATSPEREIFNQLTNRESPLVAPDHVIYFRDVYDHLIRVTDELDNYRELVSGTLDVYLSTINNNLSLIMKRLTGVTVILAGIGAVAGIFGMSEAGAALVGGESSGFWLVSGFIVALAALVAIVLRRVDWI